MFSVLKKAGGLLKKAAIVILVYAFIIGFFFYFINRSRIKINENSVAQQRTEIYQTINDPAINKNEIGKTGLLVYRSILCGTIGEACTNNPKDGDKNFTNSVVNQIARVFVYPFANPPASGVYWAYESLQNTGFVPKTYAAEGIGFSGLKPLIGLWTVFRNISYMLLVLVLITIGFMIMFRMKLNPQTVISVENALPKIVVSMILITFSYAIAGFLIDVMYILMAVGISLISNNGAYYDAAKTQLNYITAEPNRLYLGFFLKDQFIGLDFLFLMGNAVLWIIGPLQYILRTIVSGLTVVLLNNWLHFLTAAPIENATENIGAATFNIGGLLKAIISTPARFTITILLILLGFSILAPFLLGLLVWFTIVYLFFRLFFLLIKAYMNIILMVIFAPLFLLMEAIPGSKTGFSSWFKNLFAELLTFPVVAILFNIGYVISNTFIATSNKQTLWAPPFLYGFDPKAFSFILGIALVFLIPDFIKQMKEALGAKGVGINFGPGTLFGGAGAAVGGTLGAVGQYSSIAMAFPGLKMALASKAGFLRGALNVSPDEITKFQELQKAQPKTK